MALKVRKRASGNWGTGFMEKPSSARWHSAQFLKEICAYPQGTLVQRVATVESKKELRRNYVRQDQTTATRSQQLPVWAESDIRYAKTVLAQPSNRLTLSDIPEQNGLFGITGGKHLTVRAETDARNLTSMIFK